MKSQLKVTVNYKAVNLIFSLVILIVGLGLLWYRTQDPMVVLGVTLVSAAMNLRVEKE